MRQDRRDAFRSVGLLGASALAWAGLSKAAKADVGGEGHNPLLGLWNMTIPIPGAPPLYFKFAISEGAYVATGNTDATAALAGYSVGPSMGTYVQVSPRSYRLRQEVWRFDPASNPFGSATFVGSATVSQDGKSFSGSGVVTYYDVNGQLLSTASVNYTALKSFVI